MKSYTDLEQSKKLTEILPFESADMFYVAGKGEPIFIGNNGKWLWLRQERLMVAYGDDDYDALGGPDILCWSLAALLDVLPKYELNNFGNTIQLDVNLEALATEGNETLLDLVVNMIIHLHEQKLL